MTSLAAALLFCAVNAWSQSGTWTHLVNGDGSGSWSTAANWNNSVIADGADNTADFSTLDLTNLSTVTLDGARTIGNLVFGDVTPDTNWVLNTGSGDPLTLSASSGSPTITVNNEASTIGAALAGTGGFTKAGAGTLMLNNTGNLGLVGNIMVNNGVLGAAANSGTLGAASDGAGANLIIVTNGGTLFLNPNVQVNNKQLYISGTGAGGTNGAFHVNASGTSNGTRWGIGGSSTLTPFVTLTGDATLRVDGASSDTDNNSILLLHSLDIGTNTLTKTGGGRVNFDQQNKTYGSGLIHVVEGVLGFRAGGIRDGRSLIIDAGAEARITGDNGAMATSSGLVTVNGEFDLNSRGNGGVGSDTIGFSQGCGGLAGSGVVTSGLMGNTGTQTLEVQTDSGDDTFAGTITQANGVVNLVKSGTNTLTLSGSNNYNGITTINGGMLAINGSYAGGGAYTVNSGAALAGSGTISAVVNNNGGTVMAGDPVAGGTLTINSNILGNGSDSIVISNATLATSAYIGPNSQVVGTMEMNNGTLQIPLRTTGPSAFVSMLNVDGSATINFSMGTPLLGHFPIISCSSIGGASGFAGISVVAPPGITATLSNDTANATIDVVITAIPSLTWNGTPGNIWSLGGGNWQGGATYSDDLFVTFDDSLAGSPSVALSGTLSPKGITVNNTSETYTFSGSGNISGTGGIAKQGTGTLIVANSGVNDFTGGVNINSGTVQVGNGGTDGVLGSGPIANFGTLALNRSDSFALANIVSGNGVITKSGTGAATVPVSGNSTGAVTVNAGTLLLGPVGASKFSGDVTGSGSFGVNGAGTLILNGYNNTYSGGTVISNGTLQFGDESGAGALPAAGNLTDNGTLATTLSGTLANNISGSGGVSVISNASVTLSGANTYSGPTKVFGGSVSGDAASFSPNSVLILGDQSGDLGVNGSASFNSGNPVIAGLAAGGNSFNADALQLNGGGQTLTINGNVSVGAVAPSGAPVLLQPSGSGVTLMIHTNGGVFQIGLGATGSGINPDNVFVNFAGIDNFVADLGTNGTFNMGTLDGNPGPTSGATVVNQFYLAAVSNVITAGSINIGAGGRQLVPELQLGDGTNILNVDTFTAGSGGRDGSYVHFHSTSGGLRLRANDGVSPATFNVGVNPGTGTGASITNTVDFTGHPVDLLIGNLVIGDYNNGGVYQCSFSFDTGVLNAQSTSLSVIRNNNGNATASGSTLNIGGGTASLGAVNLTSSAAYGQLNLNNAEVTVASIASPGSGLATLGITNSALHVNLAGFGNPTTSPVAVDTLNADGTVDLTVNGSGLSVGQFPLISYAGNIGGAGFNALTLTNLPADVSGYLSNNTANASVDLVITSAPPAINPNPTNIVVSVSGNQLTLQWDSDHLGWLLQSNSVSLTDTSAWFTVTGSNATNKFTMPVDATKTNVFYRMKKP
jgi:autotransporter-associated beta strand protein